MEQRIMALIESGERVETIITTLLEEHPDLRLPDVLEKVKSMIAGGPYGRDTHSTDEGINFQSVDRARNVGSGA